RRLKGIEKLTINNITDRYKGKPLYRTGISVGDYPVDHHHNANPEAPEIHFPKVPSFNIPIGTLIPEDIDGLIVSDKAISVSNIINGATRLQPVVLLSGQAAGALASISVSQYKNVREVSIRQVQQTLLDAGAYLMPLFDIGPDDPDFESVQRVTSSGILEVTGESYQWANRTWFYPDSAITVFEFTTGMHAFDSKIPVENSKQPVTTGKVISVLSELLSGDVRDEVKAALKNKNGETSERDAPVTKRDLAVIIDAVVRPFDKEIGFDGRYK
ncbi:MAG: FAD-dependent oxidoreductase, partial [Bacteroidia bacterium]|nr:FAD-dependent oxidoreductase [Bacteroidia bacterium]